HEEELRALHARGVRGVRLNLVYRGGGSGLGEAARIAERARTMGWHLQVLLDVSAAPDAIGDLETLGVPLVVDHMGHLPTHAGIGHPGFRALLQAVRRGSTWVKVSGAYRLSGQALPYD